VMLHEALTRRRLFRKGDDKLAMLAEGRLPHVKQVAPEAPDRLAQICARAMAHERDDRYATADQMADDLEQWLASTQNASARDVGAYIAEVFASTRAKITSAVEEQLARFRRLGSMDEHTMPLQKLPFGFMMADPAETMPPGSIFGSSQLSGETYRGLGTPVQSPHARPSPSGGEMGSVPLPPLPAASMPVPPPLSAPPRSNVALILVSTALGGVLLAGAVAGGVLYRAKKIAASTPAVVAPTTTALEEPAKPLDIDYSIRAMPADAKAQMATGCKQAVDALKQGASALGCSI